jgi:hypothetical protein
LDEFVVGQVASRCRVLEFGLATDGVLLEHP